MVSIENREWINIIKIHNIKDKTLRLKKEKENPSLVALGSIVRSAIILGVKSFMCSNYRVNQDESIDYFTKYWNWLYFHVYKIINQLTAAW